MRRYPENIVKGIIITFVAVSMLTISYSQQNEVNLYPFILRNYTGLVGLEGIYRQIQYPGSVSAHSYLADGNMKLTTNSYFFNPDIFTMDLKGEYSTTINQLSYFSMPESSENYNVNQLAGQAQILNIVPLNLNVFGDMSNSITNRGFGQNIQFKYQNYGVSSNFSNSILPITVSYLKNNSEERDLITDIKLTSKTEQYFCNVSKDLFGFMNNSVSGNYQKVSTKYFDSSYHDNRITDLMMMNGIGSSEGFLQFNAITQFYKISGFYNNKRLNESLGLNINLPYRFKMIGGLNYVRNTFDSSDYNIVTPRVSLEHRLYSNLFTKIFYEKHQNNQNSNSLYQFKELSDYFGGNINYTKKIPFGRVTVGYDFTQQKINRNNSGNSIYIRNEEYVIDDSKQVFLKYPDVIESSVVVKDETGTLIYQKNVDYLLQPMNQYLQIVRIPSGKIQNLSTVFIDYIPQSLKSQKYSLNINNINANLAVLNGLINVFFRYNDNRYKVADQVLLSTFRNENLKTIGLNINTNSLVFNGSFSAMKSNVAPFNSLDLILSYNETFAGYASANLSADCRYVTYLLTDQKTLNTNFNAMLNVYLLRSISGSLEGRYSYAHVFNINMSSLFFKAALKVRYYETLISCGVNYFSQNYESSANKYLNVFFKVERSFGNN